MLFPLSDWIALALALLGLGALVGGGEVLQGWGWPPVVTRRGVHAGVGLLVVGTPLVFSSPGPIYGLAVGFVIINAVAKGRRQWPGIHAARPESWGTVAMPLALIPALALTWSVDPDRVVVLQAAFLILAVADPVASWVGEAARGAEWVPGATRPGSGTFFAATVVLTAAILGVEGWAPGPAAGAAVVVGAVATAVEALGRRGWDNLFVVLAVVSVLVPIREGTVVVWTVVGAALLGLGFGGGAYRAGALDARGAVAGGLFAFWLVGLGGWEWAVPGFVFFVLSSLLSRVGNQGEPMAGKMDGRTLRQVLANGGVAWGLLTVSVTVPASLGVHPVCYAGFLGALAAAAADTWATELGVRWTARPWSLRTCSRVPAGASGAVSLSGTTAAVLGAGSVGAAALLAGGSGFLAWSAVPPIVGAGLVGMIVDSVVGAFAQARYRDPVTGHWRETPHDDEDLPVRGWRWMDNEAVNLIGTTAGALAAVLFW